MTFSRYGLVVPPAGDPVGGEVLNYVETPAGWVMNCFACHGGKVAGRTIPGLPNSHYGLETLTEEVRSVKLFTGKPLSHQDLGLMRFPLGGSHGTTNAVMFGVVLDAFREPDMTVNLGRDPTAGGALVHHDMDAPPWWHVKKKSRLYIDGFSPKNHRVLMQFMLLPDADRDTVYGWEDDFRDVLAYIESVEAPPYPFEIDAALAARGERVFVANCVECHGDLRRRPRRRDIPGPDGPDRGRRHGPGAAGRPHRRSPPAPEVDLDERLRPQPGRRGPRRLRRPAVGRGVGQRPVLPQRQRADAGGSAVPEVSPDDLVPDRGRLRPRRVGLEVEVLEEMPTRDARFAFDTRRADTGKTNGGHGFAAGLSGGEKRALLEYLKTL